MPARRRLSATYERDEDGRWAGFCALSKTMSANSQGRTLAQTKDRLREAVAALLDVDVETISLTHEVKLPAAVRRRIESSQKAAQVAKTAQLTAQEETRRAAAALTAWGLSLRDAGELLSVSRQRVEQILKGG